VGGVAHRSQRIWTFAGCVFDESNWTLTVGGQRVAMETKPLELLRELLLHAGNVVTKDELLDRIWPDVTVVEASLPTAVHKLRHAFGDNRHDRCIIETVPGIGYRLTGPVEVANSPALASNAPTAMIKKAWQSGASPWRFPSRAFVVGAVAVAIAIGTYKLAPQEAAAAAARPPKNIVAQRDAATAIRELDIEAIKRMLAAGWNPATPWDKEGNDALGALLNRCEWDPGHDRRKMLLMARTLIEGGAPIDRRNVWGDTAYSISKARRYCGPDHPVTQMLEAMCYGGTMGPKDLCLATYELTAAQRRAQGLPPKG
jgi:DNA-binding winged helix-turn-helix (wHTH) protein